MKRNIGKYALWVTLFLIAVVVFCLSLIWLSSCLYVKGRMKFYILLDSDRNYFSYTYCRTNYTIAK